MNTTQDELDRTADGDPLIDPALPVRRKTR